MIDNVQDTTAKKITSAQYSECFHGKAEEALERAQDIRKIEIGFANKGSGTYMKKGGSGQGVAFFRTSATQRRINLSQIARMFSA